MPATNRVCWDWQEKINHALSWFDLGWLGFRFCRSEKDLCPRVPCSHYSSRPGETRKMSQTPWCQCHHCGGSNNDSLKQLGNSFRITRTSIRYCVSQMRIGKLLSEICYILNFLVLFQLPLFLQLFQLLENLEWNTLKRQEY